MRLPTMGSMARLLSELSATRAELLELLGVSESTLDRWLTGRSTPPLYAVALVRLHVAGELGALRPEWEGWRLTREALHDPWGRSYPPAEIAQLPALWRAARQVPGPQLELFPNDPAAALRAALRL